MTAEPLPTTVTWSYLIDQLAPQDSFQQRQLALIRSIDRQILSNQRDVAGFISKTLAKISSLYELSDGSAFFASEETVVTLVGKEGITIDIADVNSKAQQPGQPHGFCTILNKTIYCVSIGNDSIVLILRFLAPTHHKSDTESFLSVLSQQLSVYLFNLDRHLLLNCQLAVSRLFFDHNLQPSACWQGLVETFDSLMPAWRGVAPASSPAIQLLTYDTSAEVLKIVATKRSRGISKQLRPADSAIGLLLEGTEKSKLINPQKERRRYKAYAGRAMKSELMVRLEHNGKTFGVLNLEHEDEFAFNPIYIRFAKMLAEVFGPFIGGLTSRFAAYRDKELALLYTFGRTLERLGNTYGHLTEQPINEILSGVSELEYLISRDIISNTSVPGDQLAIIRAGVERIRKETASFLKEMPSYLHFEAIEVRKALNRRLGGLLRLSRDHGIDVKIHGNLEYMIYGSKIFQEHIFNLVNNAIYAVREQILSNAVPRGRVNIRFRKISEKDVEGRNTGITFVDIIISDNGGGISSDWIENVGILGRSTKQSGSGFGVAAAKEYFEAVGGALLWKNILDKSDKRVGFEMVARAQVYDRDRHVIGSPAELYKRSQK